jgi:hypothetical protein
MNWYLQMGYRGQADLYISRGFGAFTVPGNPRVGRLVTLHHVYAYHECHLDMGHSTTKKQGKLLLRLLMLTMREIL